MKKIMKVGWTLRGMKSKSFYFHLFFQVKEKLKSFLEWNLRSAKDVISDVRKKGK
jgi:hypothetical protein